MNARKYIYGKMDIIKMFGIHDQAVLLFPAVVYWGEVFATARNELGGSPELRHCHIPLKTTAAGD